MVPQALRRPAQLPRSAHGKVDLRALKQELGSGPPTP
jgi:hypothetical protein